MAPYSRVDNAFLKALAGTFCWWRMLDTGVHTTLEDSCESQRIGKTYVSQILRLTLLAPKPDPLPAAPASFSTIRR